MDRRVVWLPIVTRHVAFACLASRADRLAVRYVSPALPQDYETAQRPRAMWLRLVLHSSWGDPYYLGLDALEVLGAAGRPITVDPSRQIRAAPSSLQCLPGLEGDARTPDKLAPEAVPRIGWLTPLAASLAFNEPTPLVDALPPSGENELYILFDDPTEITGRTLPRP